MWEIGVSRGEVGKGGRRVEGQQESSEPDQTGGTRRGRYDNPKDPGVPVCRTGMALDP